MGTKFVVITTEKQYQGYTCRKRRTLKYYWHKIDGLVYIAFIISMCCLANYIEHL